MIVVDASALVAILLDEPERASFLEILGRSEAWMSPIGYWEAAIKVGRQRGLQGVAELDTLVSDLGITVAPADERIARTAVRAERDFGKRTVAKLNLGDCFVYALALELDAPLLYKGGDFPLTDVKPALAT